MGRYRSRQPPVTVARAKRVCERKRTLSIFKPPKLLSSNPNLQLQSFQPESRFAENGPFENYFLRVLALKDYQRCFSSLIRSSHFRFCDFTRRSRTHALGSKIKISAYRKRKPKNRNMKQLREIELRNKNIYKNEIYSSIDKRNI